MRATAAIQANPAALADMAKTALKVKVRTGAM
jgi:hypothetical protein